MTSHKFLIVIMKLLSWIYLKHPSYRPFGDVKPMSNVLAHAVHCIFCLYVYTTISMLPACELIQALYQGILTEREDLVQSTSLG